MTNPLSVVERISPPAPWSEGDDIPWNDPAFSQRMLAFHLDQSHDLASRQFDTVDRHVAWLHEVVLEKRPTKLLDLTCGPGLYTSRFARLGHSCVGVDFSPASIVYAKEQASADGLDCTYHEADVRNVSFPTLGTGFGLVMMVWGQINVFRREEAKKILAQARESLADGGQLVLEPQSVGHLVKASSSPPSWRTEAAGLFSDRPHVVLEEAFWDEELQTSTHRFFVIDAQTGEVTKYALSNEAYTQDQLASMLREVGFGTVEFFPSLSGEHEDDILFAVVASE